METSMKPLCKETILLCELKTMNLMCTERVLCLVQNDNNKPLKKTVTRDHRLKKIINRFPYRRCMNRVFYVC